MAVARRAAVANAGAEKTMAKPKRNVYSVLWDKNEKCWRLKLNGLWAEIAVVGLDKKTYVRAVCQLAKDNLPSQVKIFDKKGKIQKEYTYPRSSDPRRYKG